MSIKNKINEALKNAMKAQDEARKLTFRMALAAIKFSEKESQKELSDEETITLLQREIKIRQEQIAGAEKSGRTDTIAPIRNEIAWLENFLPKQLSEAEILEVVAATANETGAESPKDMGKLMGAVLAKIQGTASKSVVSQIVKKYLESK